MIESYSFGKMKIDGKKYTSDLIIFPDKIHDEWIRGKGHLLQKNDIDKIIDFNPDIIIIGTGAFGFMKISNEVINILESKNIEIISQKTGIAYKTYNKIKDKDKVVAAFHLTC